MLGLRFCYLIMASMKLRIIIKGILMNHIRILLVDDEVRYLKTIAKLLKREGFTVTTALNGIEALHVLDQKTFDIAVLDMMMPGMDGLGVLKAIKQQYPLMEVIVLTGHATVESAVEGLKLGACDYLVKPVDVNELISRIRYVHAKYEQSR